MSEQGQTTFQLKKHVYAIYPKSYFGSVYEKLEI